MNRSAVMHLLEIAAEARRVADALLAGEYDVDGEVALQGELDHLLGHLNLAWHYSRMTDQQIHALTHEQFSALMDAIPKLGLDKRLVEPWETVL